MVNPFKASSETHVVDVLGNVKGRDQPIMLIEQALNLVSLLDKDTFLKEDIVFLDPFCKAGEILLACAMTRLWHRSKYGKKPIDLSDIQKELYESDSYFAISPDERHHRLSLRTFFGNTNSHNDEYLSIIKDGHYLSETDGRLDKAKFEKELSDMLDFIKQKASNKKIIAVGNPPYQENDGGFGGSAKAIYNYFVEKLMNCDQIDNFVLVIPSRWFTAGKGTENFRKQIVKSSHIKQIVHFPYSKSVFPTVDVLGGVCFLVYDANHQGATEFSENNQSSKIKLSNSEIILDDPLGYHIVDQIMKLWNGKYVIDSAWAGKPFGLRTFHFNRHSSLNENDSKAIPCYTKRRKILYADITKIEKNNDKINEWKVAVPSAYAPGSKHGVRRVTLPKDQFFIIPKGYISTETYNIIASFKTKKEAENFISYITADLPRYLLGLRKITQHIPKDRWKWIPLVDSSKPWTNEEIFRLFEININDRKHIQNKLKEWS